MINLSRFPGFPSLVEAVRDMCLHTQGESCSQKVKVEVSTNTTGCHSNKHEQMHKLLFSPGPGYGPNPICSCGGKPGMRQELGYNSTAKPGIRNSKNGKPHSIGHLNHWITHHPFFKQNVATTSTSQRKRPSEAHIVRLLDRSSQMCHDSPVARRPWNISSGSSLMTPWSSNTQFVLSSRCSMLNDC